MNFMHGRNILSAGRNINEASNVLVMTHGRGGSAEDILSLAPHFPVKDFCLLAPEATNNTWYPYSFMVPPEENEPWLSSALSVLGDLREEVNKQGISNENIYFLGFSQGACLTLEFIARNANRYGGVMAFTGGLIGDKIYAENYQGNFNKTPVFIGTSDPDAHVPVERVYDSERILKEMNAAVSVKVYKNMGHTITKDEIDEANAFIFNPK